jgi:hypothetical protein
MRWALVALVLVAAGGGACSSSHASHDGGAIADASEEDDASADDGGEGGDDGSGPCVADAAPPSAYLAPASDGGVSSYLPQELDLGGHVSRTPTLVPITYASDPLESQLDAFTGSLGCSDYWRAVVSDYGVGAGVSTPVHLQGAAPSGITEQGIANWIGSAIGDGTLPAPTPETIYVLYYPKGTTVTLRDGTPMCQGVPGYHEDGVVGGHTIAYAVVPRCPGQGAMPVDIVTPVASHEIVEAATDPSPTTPAYDTIDSDHVAWGLAGGFEVADLCSSDDDAAFVPADLPFASSASGPTAPLSRATIPASPRRPAPTSTRSRNSRRRSRRGSRTATSRPGA